MNIEEDQNSLRAKPVFILGTTAGTLILLLGILMSVSGRFSIKDTSLINTLLLNGMELIGSIMIFLFYRKETRQDNPNFIFIRSVKTFIGIVGFILILTSLIFLASSFSDNNNSNFLAHDGLLLIMGVILTLITYLEDVEYSTYGSDLEDEEVSTEEVDEDELEAAIFKDAVFADYPRNLRTWEQKFEFRYYKMIMRLYEQRTTADKQAKVNLIIGCAIAFGGIIALLYTLQLNQLIETNGTIPILNYLSRLSLVIFIELLALFFLKLYKENINEKRYYQNELTNTEMKYLAIISSRESQDTSDFSKVIADLSLTERNFILKKGETTVTLEQSKTGNKSIDSAVDKLIKLIDKIKK